MVLTGEVLGLFKKYPTYKLSFDLTQKLRGKLFSSTLQFKGNRNRKSLKIHSAETRGIPFMSILFEFEKSIPAHPCYRVSNPASSYNKLGPSC